MTKKHTPHDERERILQKEQQKMPAKQTSVLLTMSWKETLMLIVLAIVGYILFTLFM